MAWLWKEEDTFLITSQKWGHSLEKTQNIGLYWFCSSWIKGVKIYPRISCQSAERFLREEANGLSVQLTQNGSKLQMLYYAELYSRDIPTNISLCFLFTKSIVTVQYIHACNKCHFSYPVTGTFYELKMQTATRGQRPRPWWVGRDKGRWQSIRILDEENKLRLCDLKWLGE